MTAATIAITPTAVVVNALREEIVSGHEMWTREAADESNHPDDRSSAHRRLENCVRFLEQLDRGATITATPGVLHRVVYDTLGRSLLDIGETAEKWYDLDLGAARSQLERAVGLLDLLAEIPAPERQLSPAGGTPDDYTEGR